ncbi:hypothetical protein BVY01_02310 [bacterium I07]|nr:hypothetical protein BVY01_02310 [bacterium I07]
MFMRLVHARYQLESLEDIKSVYRSVIIPRLEQVEGCMYVGLIKNEQSPGEGLSLTLWNSKEKAIAYEESGIYEDLLEQVSPFLLEENSWKLQLSEDLTLSYEDSPKGPEVKTYQSDMSEGVQIPESISGGDLLLRIITVKLQQEKINEFSRIYRSEIIPIFKQTEGCRYASFSENVIDKNEVMCLTIWDSKKALEVFESNNSFNQIMKRIEYTFSGLYHWKRAVEREIGGQTVTSEDIDQEIYSMLIEKRFQ